MAKPKETGELPVCDPECKRGKPHIGRTKQTLKARGNADGRMRSKAKVIDTYEPDNTMEGRVKEDNAIRKEGLENLDNKRRAAPG